MPVLMGFDCTVKSCLTDTCLIRIPLYYGQLASPVGKESPWFPLYSAGLQACNKNSVGVNSV